MSPSESLVLIDEARRRFLLQTTTSSYAFQVHPEGYLTHLHWGGSLKRVGDLPNPTELQRYRHRPPQKGGNSSRQEYPGWGGEFYSTPALKVDLPGGVSCVELKYRSYSLDENANFAHLIITLSDEHYPLEVNLHYQVRRDSALLERWSEIHNRGATPITLRSALSAVWHLPRLHTDYRLSHLAGRWGGEFRINRLPVMQDRIVIESRTGLSNSFATPLAVIDEGNATEHAGRVWFATIHWSGNWKISIERDGYEQVSVSGGISDFDFAWPLGAGETFTTPRFSGGLSEEGFGGASRLLHRHQMLHLLPSEIARKPMPLLFNSWASLGINVSEKTILPVAEKAAEVGAELFVIDDGWQLALGDWYADPIKFPRGLTPVIDKVRALGMDFGLWVEVESFETKSQLYREHPDWAMSFPGREPHSHYRADVDRTSLLLNFAREDVSEYMLQTLRRLLRETGIRYLKLDMNYFFSDPGWATVSPEERPTLWVRYTRHIHQLFGELSREFPHVLMENCAAGAGRADLGMSPYFSRINRSDNQDALDVLKLHEGFTWLHPSRLAGGACHISDGARFINQRDVPMKFQAYAGMMGSLSIGKNLPACTTEILSEIRSYADLYKQVRLITQFGNLYRIASHTEYPYAAFQYVSTDRCEALLFIFGHGIQFSYKVPAFRLLGLDQDILYTITELGHESENNPRNSTDYTPVTGRGLMEIGVQVELLGDFDVKLLHFKKAPPQTENLTI